MRGTRNAGSPGPGRKGWRWLPAAAVSVASVAFASVAAAQEPIPRFPFGSPVAFVPVQSVQPLPDGSWPGGGDGEEETLRAMDAELAFALDGRRGAEDWALPDDVVRRVERNPMLRMDPRRLAYQGLVEEPDRRDQIYEPLHGELRAISALFDTRYVVLPIALRAGPADLPSEEDGEASGVAREPAEAKARLLIALIDIRSSTVVWHGEIEGLPAPADSPALLATLAERVAERVAPS